MEEIWHVLGQLQGKVEIMQWMIGLLYPAVGGIYILIWRNGKNNKKL